MSDIDEPEGCFAIYFAEGEILAKQGQYTKAIDSYTKVLVDDRLYVLWRIVWYYLLLMAVDSLVPLS